MTILITGAASGIGYASALELSRRKHAVIATGRTRESLATLEQAAQAEQLTIQFAKLDVNDTGDWDQIDTWQPDVIINSAAIGESGSLSEIPLERVENILRTNVVNLIGVTQRAVKYMIQRRHGRVIIVGSTAGLVALPFLGAYNMTKFALEAAADALRMELASFNIHVSLIEPGKIDTGFNQKMTTTKYQWMNDASYFAANVPTMKWVDGEFFSNEYPVETVVRGIVKAVEQRKPKARYITPPQVGIQIRLARMLPTAWRDRLFRKVARM